MRLTRNPGRVAGLWYLLLVILGPLRLIYIPTKLFVHGNPTATVANIVANDAATLMIARGGDYLSALDKPQRETLAMIFLKLRDEQNTAAEMVWGVWLFPLAMLVYRSRFLPRFLGIWLALGGASYVLLSLTGELVPQYQSKVFAYAQPAFFGELAIMLWLMIRGARPPTDAMGFSSTTGPSPVHP
jgi:hypothetical protein